MAIAVASSNLLHFLPASSDPPYEQLQSHPSLALLSKCKSIRNFKQIHSQFIKFGLHNTQFALSKLIEFCAVSPYGNLSYAMSIFNSIHDPNHVIYNMMIRGSSLSSSPRLALDYYINMLIFGLQPNSYTFPFLLKSCTKLLTAHTGKQIHGQDAQIGQFDDALSLFQEMRKAKVSPDVSTLLSVLSACAHLAQLKLELGFDLGLKNMGMVQMFGLLMQ
ncbi:UNVERIFIED_CONTAM: Pentatricopeptide repeat-containing protein, chloroplastic [Sesamum calycinum]|uniref:Pentatricopeptide repeat-containing protein, chloroplastic n=1 Tax=Sesamum calycinum TaxID=2727403 RepID=A0AAW2QK87_9LAMI